jgi:hypothetical protein
MGQHARDPRRGRLPPTKAEHSWAVRICRWAAEMPALRILPHRVGVLREPPRSVSVEELVRRWVAHA